MNHVWGTLFSVKDPKLHSIPLHSISIHLSPLHHASLPSHPIPPRPTLLCPFPVANCELTHAISDDRKGREAWQNSSEVLCGRAERRYTGHPRHTNKTPTTHPEDTNPAYPQPLQLLALVVNLDCRAPRVGELLLFPVSFHLSIQAYAIGTSLPGENPTCPVPALSGCEGLW